MIHVHHLAALPGEVSIKCALDGTRFMAHATMGIMPQWIYQSLGIFLTMPQDG